MKTKTKKTFIIGTILLLVCTLAYFVFSNKPTSYIKVETVAVKKGNVTTVVTATGTIEPITQVEVGTQVSGVVEKIYVDFNSLVKQGQLIAELDKTNLLAALAEAQALYNNSLNEKQYKQSIYDRQEKLYNKNLITQADYDLATYNLNNAKGIIIQRKSDLDKANTNLGYANIYSPISGVVLSKDVDEGQTVAASLNTPTLFTIAQDLKEMQVEANVDEADIGQVKEGQRVSFTVDAYQEENFSGTVTQVRLNPTTTSNVVTYTVIIKTANTELKLKPGMTATITIYTMELKNIEILEAKAANYKMNKTLLIQYYEQIHQPIPKLDWAVNNRLVYILDNNKLKPREVILGINDGINIQIIDGLTSEDRVVYNLKVIAETKTPESGTSPFMPPPPGKKK